MRGAVLVAIAASIGNFLHECENATIAGALLYIKEEFNLETRPWIEGLIVAASIIGATAITTFAGGMSDWIGRRSMLTMSSILFFFSGLGMLWSPNVYVLLLARLVNGLGNGLALTLVPLYISETAPYEIRGLLNTLPQFSGSIGMFLSYSMVFGMSLTANPEWRVMLGVLSVPSLIFLALTIFFLPESPRWLVVKGKMSEAKHALQTLQGREDVSNEMALLVEGLGVGFATSIEKYITGPANGLPKDQGLALEKDNIILYGPEKNLSVDLVACDVTDEGVLESAIGLANHHGTATSQRIDTDSNKYTILQPEIGSTRGMQFPNFGSMFSVTGKQPKTEQWDVESQKESDNNGPEPDSRGDSDYNLSSPLLFRQRGMESKDTIPSNALHGLALSTRQNNSLMPGNGDAGNCMVIKGGCQVDYKLSEIEGEDGSVDPKEGKCIQEASFISQSVLRTKVLVDRLPVCEETATKEPSWTEIFEPGVKKALVVGVVLQILQQFSGINGVLYYTPEILEQGGVSVLLENVGVGSDSASILISTLSTLLMLPCIGVAMILMDVSGRRTILLTTIPALIVSLVVLIIANTISMCSTAHALLSTAGVVTYFCCFAAGFGPVPNILCSEIFPARSRAVCVAACALASWVGDVAVTYSLPALLASFGLAGLFGIYAAFCLVAWAFVYVKVPETKGMPLEAIAGNLVSKAEILSRAPCTVLI